MTLTKSKWFVRKCQNHTNHAFRAKSPQKKGRNSSLRFIMLDSWHFEVDMKMQQNAPIMFISFLYCHWVRRVVRRSSEIIPLGAWFLWSRDTVKGSPGMLITPHAPSHTVFEHVYAEKRYFFKNDHFFGDLTTVLGQAHYEWVHRRELRHPVDTQNLQRYPKTCQEHNYVCRAKTHKGTFSPSFKNEAPGGSFPTNKTIKFSGTKSLEKNECIFFIVSELCFFPSRHFTVGHTEVFWRTKLCKDHSFQRYRQNNKILFAERKPLKPTSFQMEFIWSEKYWRDGVFGWNEEEKTEDFELLKDRLYLKET